MNYSPYEMKILLEVHAGMQVTAYRGLILFVETMADFKARGLVLEDGADYVAGPNLPFLMEHVLGAPRPVVAGLRRALTKSQAKILSFLAAHQAEKGMAPTRIEIADHMSYRSNNAATNQLLVLEQKGYIKLGAGKARSIQIIP